MKSTALFSVVAGLLLGACAAPQFTASATYGDLSPDGSVSYVAAGQAAVSNTVSELGIDGGEPTFGLRGDFKWGIPHLSVATQSTSWSGDGTLTADFGGISASTNVDSDLDLALHRFVLTFDVLPTDMFELGLGFGVTVADFEASVTESGTNTTEKIDEVAPIPVLALRAGFRVWRVDLEALLAGLQVSTSDGEANYLETDLNARMAIFGAPGSVNGSLVLGWRQIDMDVEYSDSSDDAALDITFDGLYFGLQVGI